MQTGRKKYGLKRTRVIILYFSYKFGNEWSHVCRDRHVKMALEKIASYHCELSLSQHQWVVWVREKIHQINRRNFKEVVSSLDGSSAFSSSFYSTCVT